MVYQKIQLIPERPWVTLEYMGNELKGPARDAMLVIPGGGYSCVCSDREGYPIAMAYYLQGMQPFVLTYSTGEQIKTPFQPLEEASLALMYIRQHAEEFRVSENVFAVGFSAGGHLAAWLGTCWDCAEMKAALPEKGTLNRPDGVVLCYAVISAFNKVLETSFTSLYRTDTLTDEIREKVCLEKHVGADAAPAFILHTFDDGRVPIENALVLSSAYAKAGIPFEMHVYPTAPHGLALGTDVTACNCALHDDPQIARWVADSRYWMKKHVIQK